MQMKVDVDQDLHGYGVPLVHGRPELVLPHRFDCHSLQAHPQVTKHPNILRVPLRIDNQLDRDVALKICLPSLRGELRLNRMDKLWRAHATAHAHEAAAVAAPAAGARSDAVANTDAAPETLTES